MKNWKKAMGFFLASVLFVTSLAGCGSSEDKDKEQEKEKEPAYTAIDAVNPESVTLGSAQNDTVKISFDSTKWHHWEQMQNLGIALTETWEDEYTVSVVTTVNGKYPEGQEIEEENRKQLMEGMGEAGDWMTFPVSELRTFNDEIVIYIESTMDYTEEYLEYIVEAGLYTQEWVDQNRDTLLNAPNTNQIQVYAIVDGNLVSYIGTYYDDTQKQDVLDAITIAIQTTEVL